MDPQAVTQYVTELVPIATNIGLRLLGAALLWFIGRLVIRLVLAGLDRRMISGRMDETLRRYVQNAGSVLLNLLLVIALLGVMGVETTTFAGLLAAAGVAIGMAWSGLLANFAAGAFMVVLRPFHVGDFVQAGGHIGTIEEVGLFVTTLTTMDNVKTIVGNNAIFSGSIKNYSAHAYRRVDCKAQLANSVDPMEAIALLRERLAAIPNVESSPAPDVHILEFNLAGPVLCVRPYCHTDHYWQVFFDTNLLIRESFGEKGFATPGQLYRIQQSS